VVEVAVTWVPVAKVGEVARGGVLPVEVDGQPILLYRDGDQIYAYQRRCPHAGYFGGGGLGVVEPADLGVELVRLGFRFRFLRRRHSARSLSSGRRG
jgi:hypothetical protein